jgi:Fe-S cluster assembly iron-binding protein IscA
VFRGEKIRIRIRADSRDSRAISSPTRHDSALVAETDQNQPWRAEIVYVRQGLNEGFEFRNPNERDRCGCGESFRI